MARAGGGGIFAWLFFKDVSIINLFFYESHINPIRLKLLLFGTNSYSSGPSLLFDSQLPSFTLCPIPERACAGFKAIFSNSSSLPPSSKDFGGRRTLAHLLASSPSFRKNKFQLMAVCERFSSHRK